MSDTQRDTLVVAMAGISAHAAVKGWTPDAGRALAELSAELRALDAEARPKAPMPWETPITRASATKPDFQPTPKRKR